MVSRVGSTGVTLSPPVSTITYLGYRPASETRANGVVTTHEYRGDGDPPLPGGTDDFSYDECVRTLCTNAGGTVIQSTRVRRDRAQNVTQHDTFFSGAAQSAGRRHVQTFDRLGRLVSSIITRREVAGGPLVTESDVTYTLDLEGRRLTATGGNNPGVYTQKATLPPGDHQMGQYSSWPGGPLEWDDQGSLTYLSRNHSGLFCLYDAASRLVAVTNTSGGAPVQTTYAYDPLGRRTRSSTGSNDPLVPPVDTFFIYDGTTCIQELGSDGKPNVTMAAARGVHLCVISRNGTLVYPHGGGGGANAGSRVKVQFHWDRPTKDDDMSRSSSWEYYTFHSKPVIADVAMLFASPAGVTTERTDCDHAGTPIFLTSEGVIRQSATGTLSGCDWFCTRRGYGVNTRSDTPLSCDRYCPESGFLQGHGSTYSPQLGMPVAKEKKSNPLGLSATRGIAVDCRL